MHRPVLPHQGGNVADVATNEDVPDRRRGGRAMNYDALLAALVAFAFTLALFLF